eukprot:767262-Hanusia_phi.AAC.6
MRRPPGVRIWAKTVWFQSCRRNQFQVRRRKGNRGKQLSRFWEIEDRQEMEENCESRSERARSRGGRTDKYSEQKARSG